MAGTEERLKHISPLMKVSNIVGLWPQNTNISAKVLFITFISIHWMNTYFQIEFFCRNITDLNGVTEGCCTLFSLCLTGVKLHRFYIYKDEIAKILDNLLQDTMLKNLVYIKKLPRIHKIMERAWKETKIIMWLQIILVGSVAGGYSIVPFFMNLRDLIWYNYDKKYLVYNLYYPLWENVKEKSPLFEILFISESISGFTTWAGVLIFETFYCMMVLHVTSLLKILNESFIDMGSKTNLNHEDQYLYLKDCHILHKRIINLSNIVNEICSPVNLLQLLVSTTLICLTLYQTLSNLNEKSLVFFCYLTAAVNQLFLYCWFGQKLMNESLKLSASAYQCGWEMFNQKMKKNAIIILKYSQVPIQVSAWKLVLLSLETFLAVVRSSFSYYMILQTLSEE